MRGSGPGISWVEARDVVKQPPVLRTDPSAKDCAAPRVSSAGTGKPRSTGSRASRRGGSGPDIWEALKQPQMVLSREIKAKEAALGVS